MAAVTACRLPCVQRPPSGPVTHKVKSRVVTGATNTQRWPLKRRGRRCAASRDRRRRVGVRVGIRVRVGPRCAGAPSGETVLDPVEHLRVGHGATHVLRRTADRVDHDVFAGVRLREQRYRCLLPVRRVVGTRGNGAADTRRGVAIRIDARTPPIPRPVGVAENGVRNAVVVPVLDDGARPVQAVDRIQDAVVRPVAERLRHRARAVAQIGERSHRVAGDREDVAVVGGGQDQRSIEIGSLTRGIDRTIEHAGVGESAKGVPFVVRMVDSSRFHHEEVRLAGSGQNLDRFPRHLLQARLAAGVRTPVRLVVHVTRLEQTNRPSGPAQRIEPLLVPNVAIASLPQFGAQIAAVRPSSRTSLLVGRRSGKEIPPAASEDDVEPLSEPPVVACSARYQLRRNLVLQAAVVDMRVDARRRSVGDACGSDDPDRVTARCGQLANVGQSRAVAIAVEVPVLGGRAVADHT